MNLQPHLHMMYEMRYGISPNRYLRITWRVFWLLMIWSAWSARVTIFRYRFLLCIQLKLILTNILLWAIKFILSQNFCAWAIVLYLRPCGEGNHVFLHFCQKCKRQMEKNNAVFNRHCMKVQRKAWKPKEIQVELCIGTKMCWEASQGDQNYVRDCK